MTIDTESDVVDSIVNFFQRRGYQTETEKYLFTQSGDYWIADVMVIGDDMELAIECKLNGDARTAIGQSFAYNSLGFESAIAVGDPSVKEKEVLEHQPFEVYVVHEKRVTKLSDKGDFSNRELSESPIKNQEAEFRKKKYQLERELSEVKAERDKLQSKLERIPFEI